jgi:hypothetical protein
MRKGESRAGASCKAGHNARPFYRCEARIVAHFHNGATHNLLEATALLIAQDEHSERVRAGTTPRRSRNSPDSFMNGSHCRLLVNVTTTETSLHSLPELTRILAEAMLNLLGNSA